MRRNRARSVSVWRELGNVKLIYRRPGSPEPGLSVSHPFQFYPQLNFSVPSLQDCGSAAIAATDARKRILPRASGRDRILSDSEASDSNVSRCHRFAVRIQVVSNCSGSFVARCGKRRFGAAGQEVEIGGEQTGVRFPTSTQPEVPLGHEHRVQT